MRTLPTTTRSDGSRSRGDVAYVLARNQAQAHTLLLRAVKDSGLSQKDLAAITGVDEATLSRVLTRPRNIELNTLSKLVFAACGAFIKFSLSYPGEKSPTNHLYLAQKDPDELASSAVKNFRYRPASIGRSSAVNQISAKTSGTDFHFVSLETGEYRILEAERA